MLRAVSTFAATSSAKTTASCMCAASSSSHALLTPRRSMGSVPNAPNKGVREQPQVPDRLKDAVSYFGNNSQSNVIMEDTPYVPQDKRQNLLKEAMSMQQNMKSMTKMDRFRTAMSAVHELGPDDEGWADVYLFARTTEHCNELVRIPSDVFPRGAKLWIELESCEERRQPYFLKLPNGMVVLPVFSMEEYQDHFFSRLDIFEPVWFPVPRMGTRYEAFCKMPFPVCALGSIQRQAALATMAIPTSQFGILVNPGQRSSKFLTYPELIYLATQKKHSFIANEGPEPFDRSLKRAFDTTTMPLVRMSPKEVMEHIKTRPGIPQVALLELHLLLFNFSEVTEAYVKTVRRPAWKRLMGGPETLTQLDIVVSDTGNHRAWRGELQSVLQNWSFLKEFKTDVHIELLNKRQEPLDPSAMKLYDTHADGTFYRQHASVQKGALSLRQSLDFDAPLVDKDGKTVDTGPKLQGR
jgi:hypothetical protein